MTTLISIGRLLSGLRPGAAALLFLVLVPSAANAAVSSRDWKTPGDGLLTYDDVNQREWLDLSQTILSDQFPGDDPSAQVTREMRYQYVVQQTWAAGLFEGFTVAKSADAIALVQSAGVDVSTLQPAVNGAAAFAIDELLGVTYVGANDFRISIGLLDEFPSPRLGPPIRPGGSIYATSNQAGLSISEGHFQFPAPPGVFLFRNVPEPQGDFLVLTFVIALAARMRVGSPRNR